MIIYILCMVHKRAFNFIEPLNLFIDDEKKAHAAKDEYNKNRPKYAHATIKKYEVKK